MNLNQLWGVSKEVLLAISGYERIVVEKITIWASSITSNKKQSSPKSDHFKEFFDMQKPKPLTTQALEEYKNQLPKELKQEIQKIINLYDNVINPKNIEDLR